MVETLHRFFLLFSFLLVFGSRGESVCASHASVMDQYYEHLCFNGQAPSGGRMAVMGREELLRIEIYGGCGGLGLRGVTLSWKI